MGVAPEVSLVVKHTFLEYIIPDRPSKHARAYTDTDLLESAGLIVMPKAWEQQKTADAEVLEEPFMERTTTCRPSPAVGPHCWPVTPMLDAVFEPPALCAFGKSGNDVDFQATSDLKAALGICDLSMLDGLGENQMWLPDAAQPSDDMEQQMMYQTPWVFVPYTDFGDCCGWQDGCWAEPGVWPPSTSSTASGLSDAESVACSSLAEADGPGGEARTTVMLRNLPKTFSREVLLQMLDSMGFAGQYDFVYVPVDFSTGAGLGYAFINLTLPGNTARLWEAFDGFAQWEVPSDNICTVSWSDPHQGLSAHIERYQNSPVMHPDVPDEWKPALFSYGVRVDFPAPTKKLKAPKVRSKKSEAA